MGDIHLDRWQFDHLMGVIRRHRDQVAMATGAGARLKEMDLGGAEQGGAFATMALLPASFATGLAPLALGFGEG
jgi:hypothetical protein